MQILVGLLVCYCCCLLLVSVDCCLVVVVDCCLVVVVDVVDVVDLSCLFVDCWLLIIV